MKHKTIAKESANVMPAKYCPYCGGSDTSSYMDRTVCHTCGASFAVARVTSESETHSLQSFPQACELSFSEKLEALRVSCSQMLGLFDLTDLDNALSVLDPPQNVRESARSICRRAISGGLVQDAPSRKALVTAAIYVACKQNGLLRSLDEISGVVGVDRAAAEQFLSSILGEMGYLSPRHDAVRAPHTECLNQAVESEMCTREANDSTEGKEQSPYASEAKFLEKKGAFEFLRLLKEGPRRWNTLEKEVDVSPRTLSDRITQALELDLIEKIRRLKIGATYYRLTRKGREMLEAATENTSIY